jgi:hypothetical protein
VPRTGVFLRWVISASNGSRPGAKGLSPAQPRRRFFLPVRQARSDPRDRHYPVERIVGNIVDIANTMSVGTWTRFSTVPVRSLYRRPQSRHRKRRKPCTVRPSRSVVDDDWQCGQFMAALLISQNGAREPIRWGRSRQAALRSDRTAACDPWRMSAYRAKGTTRSIGWCRSIAWADFEVEAKAKNLAVDDLERDALRSRVLAQWTSLTP